MNLFGQRRDVRDTSIADKTLETAFDVVDPVPAVT